MTRHVTREAILAALADDTIPSYPLTYEEPDVSITLNLFHPVADALLAVADRRGTKLDALLYDWLIERIKAEVLADMDPEPLPPVDVGEALVQVRHTD